MVYTKVPQHIEHSYYTFSVDYHSNNHVLKKISQEYVRRGGDGFYGVVSIPYLEPSLIGKIGLSNMSKWLMSSGGKITGRVMCFKTNYRILMKLIKKLKF